MQARRVASIALDGRNKVGKSSIIIRSYISARNNLILPHIHFTTITYTALLLNMQMTCVTERQVSTPFEHHPKVSP